MAIKKQYLKSKPICKVTFSVEAIDSDNISVVGTFNNWDYEKNPLKKLKSGTFKGTIELDVDNEYEFKYLVDGAAYLNEDQADDYVWNDFAGSNNSVIKV